MRSLFLLAGVLFCTSLFAQTAQIQGTVLDSTGSAVPGADVKATQTATGQVRNVSSGADGVYVLANLPIGPYRLEVSKQGFTTYVQTGITLQVNTNPTVDVSLKVGNVSEQVQVEANAALVETQATGIGQVMENRRILELPLNGRVATDLIALTPAVIVQGSAGNGGYPGTQQYSINGGQSFGTAFWLDGSVFNNPWDNANMPFPFPDALQEFKVETSSLTAQNGVHAGGTITGVTKSGTNAFHGDAFEFLRNGDLNGTNWSTHTNDGLKRNQFGGTVGGPIKKDKLFFFFGYQGTITHQTAFANDFIPTPAMLQGDFSACPADIAGLTPAQKSLFTNNKLNPGVSYDPAAVKLAQKLPVATNGCGLSPLGLVTLVNEKQYVGRGDYQISAKNTLFGTYVRSQYYRPPSLNATPDNILTSSQGGLDDADQTWTVGDTYVFSPTIVNQLRASASRIGIRRFDSDFVDSCDLGVQNVYCGYVPHQSTFNIGAAGINGFSVGPGTGGKADAHSTILQLNDDVSWVHGAHQINFGMGGSTYKMLFLGNVYAQGLWGFGNIPSFLLGQFTSFAMSAPNPLPQQRWFINGYIQDTWKVSSRLTVNLGVRWEPSIPPGALNRSAYNFSFANMLAGITSKTFVNGPPGMSFPGDPGFQGLSGVNPQWNLFAPRVALGYDPTGTGKMTIRASFGISYDYVNGSMYVNSADSPPFGNTTIIPGGQFSNPYASNPGGNIFPFSLNANTPFAPGGTYIAEQPNNKATEVYQWNFVVQRQFGNDWVASATYTGSESQNLLASYQTNPGVYIPGNCAAGQYGLKVAGPCSNPGNTNARRLFTLNNYPGNKLYGFVDQFDTGGTSSYNGMILTIQKRLSKGLSTSANYTWSHCIGDLTLGNSTGNAGGGYTIPNNRAYDRGNCQSVEIGGIFSSDRRQNFNWTTVYETPKFSNHLTSLIASGWKFSGIYRASSAPWVTVFMSSDVALTGAANTGQRPNTNGAPSLCANPGPTCWINPAAFSAPAAGTFGNLGRSNIQAPAFWQVDMAASREFRIREGYTLEARAEAFNLSNSRRAGISPPSLFAGASGLNLTYGTPGFGTITSSLDPRILQMALKFVF
ncbi:MAG TPA: carboxypeptidase regulatory-like domain-containing protein [Bryobacteraceae bacterium]|nr:carboxypeptidase regulatory-like domain-containing protein [Bryobacteraceae bacterium]